MSPRSVLALLVCLLANTSGSGAPPASQPTSRPAEPRWVPAHAGPWRDSLQLWQIDSAGKATLLQRDAIRYASSPALCRRNRELLAFFEHYSRQRRSEFGRLAMATSRDGGKGWSRPEPIEIDGLPQPWGRPRHPAVVALPDGGVRVYFTLFAEGGRGVIASASGKDGRRFQFEPGWRLAAASTSFERPQVLRVEREWQLFASSDRPGAAIAHAHSPDGLTFERVADLNGPAAWVRGGERFRLLWPAATGLGWLASNDGAEWGLGGNPLPEAREAVACIGERETLVLGTLQSSSGKLAVARTRSRSRSARTRGASADPAAMGADAAPGEANSQGAAATQLPGQSPDQPGRTNPDSTAAGTAASDAENGAAEADAALVLDWPPEPDFVDPINYFDWFRDSILTSASDNAEPYYMDCLLSPAGDGWETRLSPDTNGIEFGRGTMPIGPWSPEEHADWDTSLQRLQPILSRYAEATRHDDYATQIRNSPGDAEQLLIGVTLPHLQPHREAARLTLANAWRAPGGQVNPESMLTALRTTFDGAEHLNQGISLIEQLVGAFETNMALNNTREALAQNVFQTPEQIEQALAVVRDHAPEPVDMQRAIRGEVGMLMDSIQYTATLGPDGQPHFDPQRIALYTKAIGVDAPPEEIAKAITNSADPREIATDVRNYYRDVAVAVDKGYPAVKAGELDRQAQEIAAKHPAIAEMIPSFARVHALRTRAVANRRATEVALAINLHKARTGSWPTSLDELPANLLGDARRDPFSGKDFVYRLTPEGPRLYTVGEDGVDNGGRHATKWGDDKEKEGDSDDHVFWPVQR